MPSSLGPAEILVILVVALIVLGPSRLPEAGRQVGKALSEVRRWTTELRSEMTQAFEADPAPTMPPMPEATTPVTPGAAPEAPIEPMLGQPAGVAPPPSVDPSPTAEVAAPTIETAVPAPSPEAPTDGRP
jgi:Tat protein translocase TatB subunit